MGVAKLSSTLPKFDAVDLEIFGRYPKAIPWNSETPPAEDQELFKDIASRLRSLFGRVSEAYDGIADLDSAASKVNASGRTQTNLWGCVYPKLAGDKSFALQITLILSAQGAELCFCLGKGQKLPNSSDNEAWLKRNLGEAKQRLLDLPEELVSSTSAALDSSYTFRKQWRLPPETSDFSTFQEWLQYAGSADSSGASVSRFLTPQELQVVGSGITDEVNSLLSVFGPVLDYVYSDWPIQTSIGLLADSSDNEPTCAGLSPKDFFAQFGGGREGWWEETTWLTVLKVLAKHEGEGYVPSNNDLLFRDLERDLEPIQKARVSRGEAKLSARGKDDKRSFLRASSKPWVETGVIRLDGKKIEVTPLGFEVLNGTKSYQDCLRCLFVNYRERRNGKNPFIPILKLVLHTDAASFDAVFDAVQSEIGPEIKALRRYSKLDGFPYNVQIDHESNAVRSVKSYLDLLQKAGLIGYVDNTVSIVDKAATEAILLRYAQAADASGLEAYEPFNTESLIRAVKGRGLIIQDATCIALVAALKSGKNVILTGPPGTAKTTLAEITAAQAQRGGLCEGYKLTTATADWTTYDTIGGLRPSADGSQLEFIKGHFLEAIDRRQWLLIDELNRSNFDRAFGQLFTVLSGQSVVLPYEDPETGKPIAVVSRDDRETVYGAKDYAILPVPRDWRIVGTMNVFDKSLLFEMSFALMRRFAFIEVPAPDNDVFRALWQRELDEAGVDPVDAEPVEQVLEGLLKLRRLKEIGPAVFKDMTRFCMELPTTLYDRGELTFQLFYSYLLPQFEGIDLRTGKRLYKALLPLLSRKELQDRLAATLNAVLGVAVSSGPPKMSEYVDEEDQDDGDEESP